MGTNFSGLTGWRRASIFERIPVTEDNQWDILTAGLDNLYYQEAEQIMLASPLVKSSVSVLEDFLNGQGWAESGEKVINRWGETMNDLLNKVAFEASQWSGAFAVHMNFNGKGEGIELQSIPISYCRMKKSTSADGRISRIAVSDNWERSPYKRILKPIDYPILNPLTAQEDTLKGGRGQILYYTGVQNGVYPLATFDSIIETAITDFSIQKYEKNNVTTGFHGGVIVHYPSPVASNEEKQKVKDKVNELLGVDSPGAMVITVDAETDKPLVETISGLDTDEIFSTTLTSVRDRILSVMQMPPALLGISPSGGVFTQLAYFESWTIYNIVSRPKRIVMSRQINKVTALMGFDVGLIIENDLGEIPNFGETNPQG